VAGDGVVGGDGAVVVTITGWGPAVVAVVVGGGLFLGL
jgi:hypothetical protein